MVSQPATTKEMAVIARRYANLLDQATLFFLQKLIAPPPPPTALSLSLPFLLSIFPHNFLFCFLLLTRNLIFGEEIHPEKITPHGGIEPLISG
jgi:hypothetical protein